MHRLARRVGFILCVPLAVIGEDNAFMGGQMLAADGAALVNTLNTTMREFDNSLDNVLTVRASVGARLNELDVVDTVAGNRLLNYEKTLSELVDLDYAKAISDYSLRQVGLQAAQKTFVDIRGLSLFEKI